MLTLIALFTFIPVIELFLLIKLGNILGVAQTLLFIIVTGLIGAILAHRQGRGLMREVKENLSKGELPADSLLHGLLILLGGLFLLAPGILTDLWGLALMLPWARLQIVKTIKKALARKIREGRVQFYSTGGMAGFTQGDPFGSGPFSAQSQAKSDQRTTPPGESCQSSRVAKVIDIRSSRAKSSHNHVSI